MKIQVSTWKNGKQVGKRQFEWASDVFDTYMNTEVFPKMDNGEIDRYVVERCSFTE